MRNDRNRSTYDHQNEILQLDRNLFELQLLPQTTTITSNPFSPTDVPTTPALVDQKSSFRPHFKYAADRLPADILTKPISNNSVSPQDQLSPLVMNQSQIVDFHSKRYSSSSIRFIDENTSNQSNHSDVQLPYLDTNRSNHPMDHPMEHIQYHYSRSPASISSPLCMSSGPDFLTEHSQHSQDRDESALRRRGYSIIRKMRDTPQGCLYEAIMFEGQEGDGPSRVSIKKTIKKWHEEGISVKDGTSMLTEEDIFKVEYPLIV